MLEDDKKQDSSGCGCGAPSSCCVKEDTDIIEPQTGQVETVSTKLNLSDHLGTLRVRLGIYRMSYTINPGLYKVGSPDQNSHVLLSANYKLSFDALRSALTGLNLWILVIDTKGINVWCAAGKGTFSSTEVVRMIAHTNLSQIVAGRKLILPQLAAPGVSAHDVYRLSGFMVIYGPVKASDIPEFIDAGLKAAPKMRRVEFGLKDRLILAPLEIVMGLKYAIIIAIGMLILSGIGINGYSIDGIKTVGVTSVLIFVVAFLGSVIIGSAFLPWLPGRAFAVKGLFVGLLMIILLIGYNIMYYNNTSMLTIASWVFIIPGLSSFVVMNFTGATTFTSLSGVLYEMRYAVPAQIAACIIGLSLWIAGLFIIT